MARGRRCVCCPEPAHKYLLCRACYEAYMRMRAILDAGSPPDRPGPARVGRTKYGGRVVRHRAGY